LANIQNIVRALKQGIWLGWNLQNIYLLDKDVGAKGSNQDKHQSY
jgi:hypothetical protein